MLPFLSARESKTKGYLETGPRALCMATTWLGKSGPVWAASSSSSLQRPHPVTGPLLEGVEGEPGPENVHIEGVVLLAGGGGAGPAVLLAQVPSRLQLRLALDHDHLARDGRALLRLPHRRQPLHIPPAPA